METASTVVQEPSANAIPKTLSEQVAPTPVPAQPTKAFDPRAPQPPTHPNNQLEEEPQQEEQQHFMTNQTTDYSGWDTSNMDQGQSVNDGQGYDHMGMNGYGDQGAGTPAIKEDGCVFTISFLSGWRLHFISSEGRNHHRR
jgi:hypothetical protein